LLLKRDGNDELLLATNDGQFYVINCLGEQICFELGEPIKGFHIGFYSCEWFSSSLSLVDPSTLSETDINQSNQAFELLLDSAASNTSDEAMLINNSQCIVYISSLTSKICLLQTDFLLPFSKFKSLPNFKFKCKNIFTSASSLNPKLADAIKNNNSVSKGQLIHNIIYS
jgi:hypothetical protein